MIVWGGQRSTELYDTGAQYDPVADSWTPTSTLGAPLGRYFHTAVWTGSRMIVYGGISRLDLDLTTGGQYDPVTDSWTATTIVEAPPNAGAHTAVWTGSRMIVWSHFGSGQYDPAADSWTPLAAVGAPSAQFGFTAVWTGSRMIIWGGIRNVDGTLTYYDAGAQYDPAADSWTPTATLGAPSGRSGHTAVWTGARMIVWGGRDDASGFNTGGQYDPEADSWIATITEGAPPHREGHTAVWTGSRMIVWGGLESSGATGGQYAPIGQLRLFRKR
jgi:N-acetylneuraminic acid mutarotase